MKKLSVRWIALLAVCAALMTLGKYVLSWLPNIEIITLLLMVYTQRLRWRTLYIIYVFVLVEGLLYGFNIWWICYLYVWTLLFFIVILFLKDTESPVIMAVAGGLFGLFFGALCSIPFIFTLGFAGAAAAFVSGLSWDIVHCIGNFLLILLLFKPLNSVFKKCCPAEMLR